MGAIEQQISNLHTIRQGENARIQEEVKNMLKLRLFDLPARFVNNELAPFGGGGSCDGSQMATIGNFGEIRRLLQPTPHARRHPPIKAFLGRSHRPGPRPQRPQDLMARRCHHADRGDGGICPRRLDRPRLANRPRFHALSADAVS